MTWASMASPRSCCSFLNARTSTSFGSFPDLETCELAVMHRQNRRVVGLQIKTISVDAAHPREPVMVWASSFRPSPTTYVVVMAWLRVDGRFFEECLLIPSVDLRSIAEPHESSGHFMFDWRPGSRSGSRLDVYRPELLRLSGHRPSPFPSGAMGPAMPTLSSSQPSKSRCRRETHHWR